MHSVGITLAVAINNERPSYEPMRMLKIASSPHFVPELKSFVKCMKLVGANPVSIEG